MGRNGSGKSTLLQIIFGSLLADYKYVTIDGIKRNSLFDNRKYIHYLPQDSFVPNHIPLKNIITCFCTAANAAILLAEPLLKPFLTQTIKQLSGGEKRIFEILLLLHSKAPYLLLDEPFNGISPLQIEIIKELIKKHSVLKGIIITDHSYENVLAIASSVVLLDNGNTIVINQRQQLVDYGYLSK